MMATLNLKKTNQVLIPQLEVVDTFWSRGKGLLGRSNLEDHQALWIHRCNSIHTFFMKFAIDCIFVDKTMKVRAIYRDVRPGRLVPPVWGASSVIEMASGASDKYQIQVGDEFYVGS